MAVDHYENFPVASLLLPRHLHAPIAAIYRFARCADDIADEGTASPEERLAQLKDYDAALTAIGENRPPPAHLASIFVPLALEHQRIGLPLAPCHALLSAFMQDVHQTRYATYTDLLDYCRRSANPVGQLMLFLFKSATPENLAMSDAICTALQLTNHWQDIAIDAKKGAQGRIYLPQDELAEWGYTENEILSGSAQRQDPTRWARFMRFQTSRVASLFSQGQALPTRLGQLSWRIGQELRLTVAGGRRILQKIDAIAGDVYQHRPTLNWRDWLALLIRR
jgi:squalene synthase HpnC